MRLVDPRGDLDRIPRALAARRPRAQLARIGFLANEEEFMRAALHFPRYTRILERVLPGRVGHPVAFHHEVKPLLSRPAEPEQLDRFVGWDAVVNGLAK
jgi:hypothetical protein